MRSTLLSWIPSGRRVHTAGLALTLSVLLGVSALPNATAAASPPTQTASVASLPQFSAAAKVTEVPRPSSGPWTLTGQGEGHGRGMSQYGAKAQAEAGRSAGQILAFYYPGAVRDTVPASTTIRVWISFGQGAAALPRASVNDSPEVRVEPGLVVTSVNTGNRLALPAGATAVTSRPRGANGFDLLAKVNGSWQTVSSPGGAIRYSGLTELTLIFTSGTRSYRGTMTAERYGSGAMTINTVRLEDYLRSVVPRESPSSWPLESLRAQSVAARTYAMANVRTTRAWDLCDTTYCQVYGGTSYAGGENSRTDTAIAATAGVIRTYQGRPINAQFGSSNGGHTVYGGVPYLKAVADPWDRQGIPSSIAQWKAELLPSRVEQSYPQLGSVRSLKITQRDGLGPFGGRVEWVDLVGSATTVRVSGATLRSLAGGQSTLFTVTAPSPPVTEPVVGTWDSMTRTAFGVSVSGWAFARSATDAPVTIRHTVTWQDGSRQQYSIVTTKQRADVARAYATGATDLGYSGSLPLVSIGSATICATAMSVGPGSSNRSLGCRVVTARKPIGAVDRVARQDDGTILVTGWTLSPDVPTASLKIAANWSGGAASGVTRSVASVSRGDIERRYPDAGPLHGFRLVIPATAVGSQRVCVVTDQVAVGAARTTLGCATVN